jgi:hypothetical protein
MEKIIPGGFRSDVLFISSVVARFRSSAGDKNYSDASHPNVENAERAEGPVKDAGKY